MTFERNCVNCGHALKITEWGPNHICPFCGNNTVNVDIKEVHITFGDSHSQSFTHFISDEALNSVLNRCGTKYSLGIDYQHIRLYYELCFGDINDPPFSNANYYAHYYGCANNARIRVARQLEKLETIDHAIPVYLWLSDNEVNELLNLLCFANNFNRFENVFLVKWRHTEKDFDGARESMIAAVEAKTKLSKQDLNDYSARFIEIQKWNAECLLGNFDHIEPWAFSKVEEYVLACMSKAYRSFGAIYSQVFDTIKKETSFYISYHMIQEAVHHLMMNGKIESHGACEWWGKSCYNNMICTQEFRIASHPPKTYTNLEALDVVCDAFEFGYIYPLYDLLSEDSVLVKEDLSFVGKRKIIEFIENDGSKRVNCHKQKVTCDIKKAEAGRNYQKGNIYILLCYEKEEAKEYWLVKVCFNGNYILNIELSKPQSELNLLAIE